MSNKPIIVWFRQDLRVRDNPALFQAAQSGEILPIYILDDENSKEWKMGGASRVWLQHALEDLNASLNGCLQVHVGNPLDILQQLDPSEIHWNRCYEPWRIARDKEIKAHFQDTGVTVTSHNGSLLWEPWDVKKKDGTPYKVFTPYYRKGCLSLDDPRDELDTFDFTCLKTDCRPFDVVQDEKPWTRSILEGWDVSEQGAHNRLNDFLKDGLRSYKKGRDFPALNSVSRLSPYLHFGQISPHQVWHTARFFAQTHQIDRDIDHFCSELAWREFSYSLLYQHPNLADVNLNQKFNAFPWRKDEAAFDAWTKGKTGYPIIDAGMRELWQTGYMHNRVRMIVASFLIKNLMIDWRLGERWFWDCLFDADHANNAASWQWVAGCGADAAPFFRIFNPVTQSKKFDPEGEYIRTFVPELANMDSKYIHEPWTCPSPAKGYPRPIVDLKPTRERALEAFKSLE
ncbi:cryptochrome/photolyase family protein [Terasakiella pusilla]|uniref:cryptochrome/photolyase family protein n=1 Tax=Terasakiella pusilla TaxID=64973 RepID=UPI003AA806CA